jgi:hypothetical protein
VGLLTQGSSLGQLLVPPLVVAAGSAVPSWTATPATLSGLAALAVVGGVLYRRWDVPLGPGDRQVRRSDVTAPGGTGYVNCPESAPEDPRGQIDTLP